MNNYQQYKKPEPIPPSKLLSKSFPGGIDAEINLLGSIIIDNSNLNEIQSFVKSEDFYSSAHEKIYEEIIELSKDGADFDSFILVDSLRNKKLLARIGGEQYIATLMAEVYSSAHAIEYAKIVKRWSTLRQFEIVGREGVNAIETEAWEPEKMLESQISKLEKIQDNLHQEEKQFKIGELLSAIIEGANEDKQNEPLLTKIKNIDEMGILNTSELTIIAARPSMGKTALAINLIENVCDQKTEVMFFSLEMSDLQVITRMLSSRSGFDSDLFKKVECGADRFTDDEMNNLRNCAGIINELPLTIVDDSNLTMNKLKMHLRKKNNQLKRAGKEPVGMIVVDYIQIMKWSRSDYINEAHALASMATEAKNLAKEHEIPFVMLAQLNRNVETRTDLVPKLADIKGSGGIEEAADVALMMWRKDYQTRKKAGEPNAVSTAHMICCKNRNGKVGDFDLFYSPWRHKFEDPWKTLEEKEARQ